MILLTSIKAINRSQLIILTAVIIGFLTALISLLQIKVEQMGTDPLFVLQIIPLPYWIGISLIFFGLFFMITKLNNRSFQLIFLFSSLLLIICFRMVFSIIFTSIIGFEPDVIHYSKIINSWVNNGINLGVDGNYEHDYPLSFIFAYAIIKLGVPTDTFLRVAPFFIYSTILLLLFFIVKLVAPERKKNSVPLITVFLFSFSSLGYWVTVHYCPDLFGAMMLLLCLYFSIKLIKKNDWGIKSLLPAIICIFFIILSHHLNVLYLIIVFFGFSLSCWFFKPPIFKRGALHFFLLGIITYTIWFAYGTLIYPNFFNVYVYFSGFADPIQQSSGAGVTNNMLFVVYPLFILILFIIEFLKIIQIKNLKSIFSFSILHTIRNKIVEIKINQRGNNLLVFTLGFCLILITFIMGFGVPVLFGSRVLELLCIGLYPLSSKCLPRFSKGRFF